MVSAQHYDAPSSASSLFLSDEIFRVPDIKNVMNNVFGSERSGKEAEWWKQYWNELNQLYQLYSIQLVYYIRYYTGNFRACGAGIILTLHTRQEPRCAGLYHTDPNPIQTQHYSE